MAKIRNPIKFSEHFEVEEATLDRLDVLDPTLNVDVRLFIDPLLLPLSKHAEMRSASKSFRVFFSTVIKLLAASRREGDVAWREAVRRLQFREVPGTCLGYSAASIRGSAFGPDLSRRLVATAKEIVDLGVTDPDLFVALPLLEEGVGPDLISDMTTNIVLPDLLRFNERILRSLDIPTRQIALGVHTARLPINPTDRRQSPVILLPKDVLRELPVAYDWDSVCDAAAKNALLRAKTNSLIGAIWKAKTRRQKQTVREGVLASKEAFSALLEAIHVTEPRNYDFENDPEGLLVWRHLLTSAAREHPMALMLSARPSPDDVFAVVMKIVEQFKFLIANRGLWKELWHEGTRRPEKSAQRLFFAVAHSYCDANDLDINPEMDTGTGSVDFKFSVGATAKVIVETKLSDNPKIVSGYEKQLEVYKTSERTTKGVYVVIDVGGIGKKDQTILKIKNERTAKGLPASEVVFVDGNAKASASKL
jgi:hypothetical protein